jgi:hypothetical protein
LLLPLFIIFARQNKESEKGLLNTNILKRQTSRSHYGSKAPAVTITVFKYRNKIGKIVVKTVPYSVNVNVKNTLMKMWK